MGLWLQHLLVIFLIVGMPLWDWYEIPRLKASADPEKKIKYYRKVVSALWILALIAVATIGLRRAFYLSPSAEEMSWLGGHAVDPKFLIGLIVGSLIAIFLPALAARRSERFRQQSVKVAKKLAFLLPSTIEERRWWWLVCFTAGVCEELIYRGFLLQYFHVGPWHLPLTQALIVAAIIFGIAHLYQGIAGAVGTCALGFLLGCLFLITGSLLVPMVLHALIDLRVLMMLPEGFEKLE